MKYRKVLFNEEMKLEVYFPYLQHVSYLHKVSF